MNRRHFLARLLGFSVALPATISVFSACGGGSDGGGSGDKPDGDCSTGAPVNYTNQTHGHSEITLTAVEITDAVPGDYTLLGPGGHSHTVTLSAQHFLELEAGMTLSLRSNFTNGHRHTLKVGC